VLGTHGRSGFARLVLGSVTERLPANRERSDYDGSPTREKTRVGTVRSDSMPAGFLR
jgi:hypothetical protein